MATKFLVVRAYIEITMKHFHGHFFGDISVVYYVQNCTCCMHVMVNDVSTSVLLRTSRFINRSIDDLFQSLTLLAVSVCNGTVPIHPSVCSVDRQQRRRAAGLLQLGRGWQVAGSCRRRVPAIDR